MKRLTARRALTLPVGSDLTYAWNTGSNAASIDGLTAGGYIVTVTSGGVCESIETVTITTTPRPSAEIVNSNDELVVREATDAATCDRPQYGFYFPRLHPGGANGFYNLVNGQFVENPEAGTARLTGTVNYVASLNWSYDVDITFSNRTAVAPPMSPVENELCIGDVDNSEWYYYETISGTMTGNRYLEGAVVKVTLRDKAFQVGTAANLNDETAFGASGWTTFETVSQPNDPQYTIDDAERGDINITLTGDAYTPGQQPDGFYINAGESTTIGVVSDDPAASFVWSTGETTPEITVSPMTTTDYSVTVTGANGCSSVATQTVTVATDDVMAREANDTDDIVRANRNEAYAAPKATTSNSTESALTGSTLPGNAAPAAAPSFDTDFDVASEPFVLEQNVPNPYAGVTQISFSVPTSDRVELFVHDMTGRQVRRVVTEATAGLNAITFEANELQSGTYLYTLIYQGQRSTKRMVVAQ